MSRVNSTMIDALLVQYDSKEVKQLFVQADAFLSEIKKFAKVTNTSQKGKVDRNITRVNGNVTGGGAGMTYPGGVSFESDQYHVYPINQVMTIEIDDMTYDDLNGMNGSPSQSKAVASFSQLIDLTMKQLAEDRSMSFAQGTGNGALATTAASATTTVVPFYTTPDGLPNRSHGLQRLRPGVLYDICTSSGPVSGLTDISFTKSEIDYSTNTITFGTALASAPADGTFWVPANSFGYGVNGLPYLISGTKTGSWQGVNVAGSIEHQSVHFNADGQRMSIALQQKANSKLKIRNRGKKSYKILGCTGQNDIWRSIGWNFRRYTGTEKTFDPAFDEGRYGGNPFLDFDELDVDRQYIVADMSDFEIVQQKEFGIINRSGVVLKEKTGSGTGEGNYYMNIGGADNLKINTPAHYEVIVDLEVDADLATLGKQYSTT